MVGIAEAVMARAAVEAEMKYFMLLEKVGQRETDKIAVVVVVAVNERSWHQAFERMEVGIK